MKRAHGTYARYAGSGCRCQVCKDANNDYSRAQKARLRTEEPKKHGTYSAYMNHGCRCEECKEAGRNARLIRRYGISAADLETLISQQSGNCALCLRSLNTRKWVIDHDHVTEEVRGVLCYSCNGALGRLNEDADLIEAAIRYLEK